MVAPGLPHLERSVTGQDGKPARHSTFGESCCRVAFASQIVEGMHQSPVVRGEVPRLRPGLHHPLLFTGLLDRLLQTFEFVLRISVMPVLVMELSLFIRG